MERQGIFVKKWTSATLDTSLLDSFGALSFFDGEGTFFVSFLVLLAFLPFFLSGVKRLFFFVTLTGETGIHSR